MPDLVVNTENLRSLETHLGAIHRTLNDAESDAQDLAAMIPHANLASWWVPGSTSPPASASGPGAAAPHGLADWQLR